MKYIWRKRAGEFWLRSRSESLTLRFGGALAVIERPGAKRVILEALCANGPDARDPVREYGGTIEKLRAGWLEHFARQASGKPLRIGPRLIILSAPTQRETARRTLIIPAETAFGTGHHATTAMCLRLLERMTRRFAPGWRMLDAGTGSGILALAASCFGAGQVIALDNDPLASTTAKRNARANRIRNVEFTTGDVLKHKLIGKFGVITANLFSEIVIEALPIWSRHLAADGRMILSGILRSQEADVVRALRQHRLDISEIRRRGKWIAMVVVGTVHAPSP